MEAREGSQVPCFLTFNLISLSLDLSLNLELGMDPVVPRDPLVSDPTPIQDAGAMLGFLQGAGDLSSKCSYPLSHLPSPDTDYIFFPEYWLPIYTCVCV